MSTHKEATRSLLWFLSLSVYQVFYHQVLPTTCMDVFFPRYRVPLFKYLLQIYPPSVLYLYVDVSYACPLRYFPDSDPSLHVTPRILLKHLPSKLLSLFFVSLLIIHVSATYSSTDLTLLLLNGQELIFISSGTKIVKPIRRRQYDLGIIEKTIGLVLGPFTTMSRLFLKHCTPTNEAVGTWRVLS